MDRLQELINGAEEIINKPVFNDCADHVGTTVELGWIRGVYSFLKSQPNVVLCKDCKHAGNVIEKPKHPMFGKRWCNGKTKGWHCGDWYCGDGEPKEGDWE